MSNFDYLACSRELPTGLFGVPPKAIYDSYKAYRNSANFVMPRDPAANRMADWNCEHQKKVEQLKGKVIVYETVSDTQGLRLEPYEPITTYRGNEVFETSRKVMAKHFTLPYLYDLYVTSEKTLMEFLCKYLQPGDQAEVYTCWAGEERKKYKGEIRIIDLQDAVQGRDLLEQGGTFTRYIAPSAPQLQNRIAPVKQVGHVISVIKEIGQVGVVVHLAQEQGFFAQP